LDGGTTGKKRSLPPIKFGFDNLEISREETLEILDEDHFGKDDNVAEVR
jgi:hypothetical protein